MQERRQFIRVQTPIMVEFADPSTTAPQRSFTQDVSETGMRFPSAAKLQIGQSLPMTLHVPFFDQALHATGEVVWLRQTSRLGGPQYEVGVRFQWIEDPDRQNLLRHLTGLVQPRV